MTPAEIEEYFKPAFQQAKELRDSYKKSRDRVEGRDCSTHRMSSDSKKFLQRLPFVTVCKLLDNIQSNTASLVKWLKNRSLA